MARGDLLLVGYVVWAVIGLNAFANTLYLIWVARRRATPARWPRLSVIIPARDEEANLRRLLPTLTAQDYPHLEVVVYDDASSDRTAEVAASLGARVLRGGDLPEGWLGKPHACHQAAMSASGEVLLFLDADAEWPHPAAVRRLVSRWLALPVPSALTALPRFAGGGLVLVSILAVALLFIPLTAAAWLRWPAFGGLNGQCWMIGADLYRELQPHRKFRDAIVEDIAIGRWLLGRGIVPWATPAAADLTVHMYGSLAEAWRGFRKNFYFISGGSMPLFLITWTSLTLVLVVGPLAFWQLLAILLATKFVIDRWARLPWWLWLLAPLTGALALGVYLDSMITWSRGKAVWKGRQVSGKPGR